MYTTRPVGLPLDPFQGVNTTLWERRIARAKPGILYLTTNFQNPTGYSYSTQELNQIIAWSRQYNFGIVEDDWGSDMLSFSEFKPSLRARGGNGIFYINTFTKKLLPSLRLGYIVGNKKTTPALVASKVASCLGISSVVEVALFEFLDRGYYDVYLKQLQAELDRRYQNCLSALRATMPQDIKWTAPGGGPILWLELPKHVHLEKLTHKLAEKGVIINLSCKPPGRVLSVFKGCAKSRWGKNTKHQPGKQGHFSHTTYLISKTCDLFCQSVKPAFPLGRKPPVHRR